jgi:hypothetical protein
LSVAWNYLIYLSAPAAKTLRIVGVGEENEPAESSGLNYWGVTGLLLVGMRASGEEVAFYEEKARRDKVGPESCYIEVNRLPCRI